MKLVLIDWVDSFGCSSTWESLADCQPEPMLCRSVGWLLHDGDESKVIVPHIASNATQGCGDMTIPVEAIRKIVSLDVPQAPATLRTADQARP